LCGRRPQVRRAGREMEGEGDGDGDGDGDGEAAEQKRSERADRGWLWRIERRGGERCSQTMARNETGRIRREALALWGRRAGLYRSSGTGRVFAVVAGGRTAVRRRCRRATKRAVARMARTGGGRSHASTVPCGTAQYRTARHSTAQHSTAQYLRVLVASSASVWRQLRPGVAGDEARLHSARLLLAFAAARASRRPWRCLRRRRARHPHPGARVEPAQRRAAQRRACSLWPAATPTVRRQRRETEG